MAPRAKVTLRAALAATALTGLLAACGATLEQASAEKQIAGRLSTQFAIPPPKVTCPPRVPATVGHSFRCTLELAGRSVGVDATVTAGNGRFDVSLSQLVLSSSRATSTLARDLSAKTGKPTRVSCATGRVIVVQKGERLSCTAQQGKVSLPLSVVFVDSRGDLHYSLG